MTLKITKNYSAKEAKNTYCMQSVLSTIQLANLKEDSYFSECISRLCRTYVVLYQETTRSEFCQFWLNSNCNLDCKSEHFFWKGGRPRPLQVWTWTWETQNCKRTDSMQTHLSQHDNQFLADFRRFLTLYILLSVHQLLLITYKRCFSERFSEAYIPSYQFLTGIQPNCIIWHGDLQVCV